MVREVGFILLLISRSGNSQESSPTRHLLMKPDWLKKGRLKIGDKATTPEIGRSVFCCSRASTRRLPKP